MNSNALRLFRQYLKDHDLRMTSERLRIAMLVATFDAPFTGDNIHDSLRKVSRATIYRTLNLLVDAGLLAHVVSSYGEQFYSTSSIVAGGTLLEGSKLRKQALKYEQLCTASHSAVIVGTCPWCGAAIIPAE